MAWVLASMQGSTLREVAFGEAAVRLEFSKSDKESWAVFRLKTTNFISTSKQRYAEYEVEIVEAMPVLYQALGRELAEFSHSGGLALMRFQGGDTLFIRDDEQIWDNIFSIKLENEGGRSEYLYCTNP